MSEFRCPHCRTALPEKATFCGACGRRIEGWSVPDNVTPAAGEPALPDGDQPTRQMEVTPSLLRAAALSLRRGGKRSRLPLLAGMVVVAAGGGIAGFLIVRAHLPHRHPAPQHESTADGRPATATASPTATPANVTPPEPPVAPAPAAPAKVERVRRDKAGKKAHVIAAAPVSMPQRRHHHKLAPGALPHKEVATDSRSVVQQQAHERQAAASPAPTPNAQPPTTQHTPPPLAADSRDEAEARLDADSIRFVVQAHLGQVRACYGRAFKDSSPGGTVEIGFAIDPSGRARNVRTETNTTDSELLAHCLEARVRDWQFPRPVGGSYELIYPFVFAPGS